MVLVFCCLSSVKNNNNNADLKKLPTVGGRQRDNADSVREQLDDVSSCTQATSGLATKIVNIFFANVIPT